jgi:hypothetical protein
MWGLHWWRQSSSKEEKSEALGREHAGEGIVYVNIDQ